MWAGGRVTNGFAGAGSVLDVPDQAGKRSSLQELMDDAGAERAASTCSRAGWQRSSTTELDWQAVSAELQALASISEPYADFQRASSLFPLG